MSPSVDDDRRVHRLGVGICALGAAVLLVSAGFAGASSDAAGRAAGMRWVLTVLANRGEAASPVALNERGLIVGVITVTDPQHPDSMGNECCWRAVRWQQGRIAQLGMLGGAESLAAAVNERGQIVGWSKTRSGETHAVLWQDGQTVDLGRGLAVEINEVGVVVGIDGDRGFVWERGVRRELTFNPTAVNDRGEVVGWRLISAPPSWPGDYKARPFYWRSGRVRLLPSLPGFASSSAEAINAHGEIAGLTMTANGDQHLVLWRGGRMHDLGVIGRGRGVGHISSVEVGQVFLNQRGQVAVATNDGIGSRTFATGAFVFDGTRLHRLPVQVREVDGLNERGQVIGAGARSGLIWAAGRLTRLPGVGAHASAINNRAEIIGTAGNRAVLWRPTSNSG